MSTQLRSSEIERTVPFVDGRRAEAWVLYSLGMAVFFAIATGLAMMFEDRTLNDVDLWIKPLKFSTSVVIHSLTLWLAIRMLPSKVRESKGVIRSMGIYAFCATVEIEYIVLQAARGRHSHFNFETKLEGFLYQGMMGPMAVALVVCSWWIGRALWKNRTETKEFSGLMSELGTRAGLGLGLIVGAIATLVVASIMSSGQVSGPGHWVGGIKSDGAGLFFLGWSTTGGDLRVAHFFSNHTPQFVLLIGWLAGKVGSKNPVAWGWGASIVSVAVIALTFIQALMGHPLIAS